MSVPTTLPTAQELAVARYETSTAVRNLAVAAAVSAWLSQNPDSIAQNFMGGLLTRLRAIVSGARRRVVDGADDYVAASMRAQKLDVVQAAKIDVAGFDQEASDGRNLDNLLYEVVIDAKVRIATGTEPKQALRESGMMLERIVSTQIMDASRAADQVSIVTLEPAPNAELPSTVPKIDAGYAGSENALPPKEIREVVEPTKKAAKLDKYGNPMGGRFGYIRMLNLPSCGRCALLAGRWYGWNAGFKRHPMCDCIHIPCLVANPEADLKLIDPRSYFNSLSEADQNKYFGVAASKAIRGNPDDPFSQADIYQVVNATSRKGAVYTAGGKKYTREGTTRRGIYGGRNGAGQRVRGGRLTPEQIYKDADGDRIEALRLLRKYGYIVS